MTAPLRSLDLFSGYGGLTLGLSRWMRPAAYCEIERYAQAILLSNMRRGVLPTAPIVKDITKISARWLRTLRIDAVVGGFPCQDISAANTRGRGLSGERSGLFHEIMRITDLLRPKIVFLENVPALTFRGLDVVLGALAARGYAAEWEIISAASVGAPHIRERIWVLAYPEGERCEAGYAANDVPNGVARHKGRGYTVQVLSASGYGPAPRAKGWETEPRICRVDDGSAHVVDRIRALGNGVVPAQAEKAFQTLAARAASDG